MQMKEQLNSRAPGILVTLLMLAVLNGCGFAMRGSADLPSNMQVMAIQGVNRYSDFARDMRAALQANGVQVVDEAASAQAVLNIHGIADQQRVLSISAETGKAKEYQLYYDVVFDVRDSGGNVLMERQRVRQISDYTFDDTQILGKQRERTQIMGEMRRDAIQQMLRRMAIQQG